MNSMPHSRRKTDGTKCGVTGTENRPWVNTVCVFGRHDSWGYFIRGAIPCRKSAAGERIYTIRHGNNGVAAVKTDAQGSRSGGRMPPGVMKTPGLRVAPAPSRKGDPQDIEGETMKETQGTVYSMLPNGLALIATALPEDTDNVVRVLWPDRDEITPDQRRKIFAIVGEIACWSGYAPEDARKGLTVDFLRQNIERLQLSAISLAMGGGCDKGTASLYIEYLINFCLENSVPTKQPLMELADDLERYTYAALMHKKCVVCGKKADLHHVDAIGMGYNRREKPQIGNMILPLCMEHHTEWHGIGGSAFEKRYHVVPVQMDKRIADKYGLSKKAKEESA